MPSDIFWYILARFKHSNINSTGKSKGICTTMTFNHDTLQTDKVGAIKRSRIKFFTEHFQHWGCNDPGNFGQDVTAKCLTQIMTNHMCDTFAGFQGDIADKTITHQNIYITMVKAVALNKTMI